MQSDADFRAHLQAAVLPVLEPLEARRKGIVRKLTAGSLAIGGASLGLGGWLAGRAEAGAPLLVALVVGALLIAGLVALLTHGFVQDFKNAVIAPIVAFVDPTLQYAPRGCIPQWEFQRSGLFKQGIDRYRGEDLVTGTLDKTAIRFSELHAEYKTTSTDSKGRRRTQWHTIFRGLFFIADFNKHFSGQTVVLPDAAQRFLGRLGQALQNMNMARDQLVKLEDPEFEKEFVVYGTDQVEARYILSTSLMRRILEFKRKMRVSIHVAFVDSSIFLAIGTGRNLFEPRLFRTLLDEKLLSEFLNDVRMATGIVEDLNLNTRVWTKE